MKRFELKTLERVKKGDFALRVENPTALGFYVLTREELKELKALIESKLAE